MAASKLLFLIAAVWLAVLKVTNAAAIEVESLEKRQDGNKWVSSWTSMPQLVEPNNLPPQPFVRSSHSKGFPSY